MYIDVREKDEWDLGHLDGALHLPLSELQAGKIPEDLPRDIPLYLYCARGRRALIAKAILAPTYPLAQNLTKGYEELALNLNRDLDLNL